MNSIILHDQAFDPEAEQRDFRSNRPATGAIVSFLGLMRDLNQGDSVSQMTLEHYPGMTEKALAAIVDQAQQRWPLDGVRLIHRIGDLQPEEPIVLVLVASPHRGEAFRACEYIIDLLKTQAPFWKRETLTDGSNRWVQGRSSDQEAQHKWQA